MVRDLIQSLVIDLKAVLVLRIAGLPRRSDQALHIVRKWVGNADAGLGISLNAVEQFIENQVQPLIKSFFGCIHILDSPPGRHEPGLPLSQVMI